MGKYSISEIKAIILTNPNKDLVHKGQQAAAKLTMHLYGKGLKDSMKREDYFENADVYKARSEKPVSNRDIFARLLQQEDMVFTARGGSSRFGLSDAQEKQMNALLSNVRYNLSLRNWIKNFALPAYRTDPMGLIFMEVEQMLEIGANGAITTPKCYPTYKSSQSIFDYQTNGRDLEYVCFTLTIKEVLALGITDKDFEVSQDNQNKTQSEKITNYFRFVDDEKDIIVKKQDTTVIIATNVKKNPIPNPWGKTPAYIVSDLMQFDDPQCFTSPVGFVIELADCFLYDRSIRDLQKKYHGFAKAIEPLLKCPTCEGTGLAKGAACPDCTPIGQDKGIGYKLKTKVSDVAKFPLEILENANFDFRKIFGYVAPDIATWNKQDASLEDLERIIYRTYWGTEMESKTSGAKMSSSGGSVSTDNTQETATKTLSNLQPKYARLNVTADWAERLENLIADFIGQYWLGESFKEAQITYGRNWILETPNDLIQQYYDMRKNGAPDFMLDEALERYLRCLYQNNPTQLAKYMKLLEVEPFPHVDAKNCLPPGATPTNGMMVIPSDDDYLAKIYFGEWYNTLQDMYIIKTKPDQLKKDLAAYVEAKEIEEPEPVVPPTGGPNNDALKQLQDQLAAAKTTQEKQAIQSKIDALQNV